MACNNRNFKISEVTILPWRLQRLRLSSPIRKRRMYLRPYAYCTFPIPAKLFKLLNLRIKTNQIRMQDSIKFEEILNRYTVMNSMVKKNQTSS